MADGTEDYAKYFLLDQQVSVGFQLEDNKFFDGHGVVLSLVRERLCVELIGNGLPPHVSLKAGAEAILCVVSDSWGVIRCDAMLEQEVMGDVATLRLTGSVSEQQRREYFRLDVSIPIVYGIPEEQDLKELTTIWEANRQSRMDSGIAPIMLPYGDGFKVYKWRGGEDLMPSSLNLSGGGIRFKMPGFVELKSYVNLDIFLPIVPSRLINVVGEVVRVRELELGWEASNIFITALHFCCIDEKDRQTIISYLFSEQRRKLRKDWEQGGTRWG